MPSTDMPPVRETSLGSDILYAVRYYLSGRRGLVAVAAIAAIAGLTLNWSWLVAAGIAPILIALAPCAVMCALGLCMTRMNGGSRPTENNPAESIDSLNAAEKKPTRLEEDN